MPDVKPPDQKPPETPPAEPKKTEAKKVSLPPPHKGLKGPEAERVKIWARQSKQGLITLCGHKGCYYPLDPKRDPSTGGDPLLNKDDEGRVYTVGVCSWDPDHGEQKIYPPTKEDELDPDME